MKIGPAMMVLGGGAAAAGSFLEWASDPRHTITGWEGGDGKITLACGAVALILGLIALAGKGVPKASLMIVGILAGLGAAGTGVMDYLDIRNKAEMAEKAGSFIKPGIGLYLVMVGGVVAALGALLRPKASS